MNQSSCALLYGIAGTSGPPMRITGASRPSKASSAMSAAISAPAPNRRLSSYTIKHFPVFRASRRIVAASSGRRLRTSTTFTDTPSPASVPAAPGHADDHRHAVSAVAPIADARGLVDDLLERRSAEVRELHLRDRKQSAHRSADRDADDRGLRDRCVDDPVAAELLDESIGD